MYDVYVNVECLTYINSFQTKPKKSPTQEEQKKHTPLTLAAHVFNDK